MDLNEDNLNNAKEELKDNVITVVTNVADEDSVKNAIQAAVEEFGAIHILVNCAGIEAHQRQWEGMEHIL